jgi:hypothetical protein
MTGFSAPTRCSAAPRSFLRGPDGPAGPPPGHCLRSGGYMAATRSETNGKIRPIRMCQRFQGNPGYRSRSVLARKLSREAGPVLHPFEPGLHQAVSWLMLCLVRLDQRPFEVGASLGTEHLI